jgi:hypothetical protein
MKEIELRNNINNKMQKKSEHFPKSLALMSLVKKTSMLKNEGTSAIFSRP